MLNNQPTQGEFLGRRPFAEALDEQGFNEGQCVGASLVFTVRGVNDAGEGPANAGDTVVSE